MFRFASRWLDRPLAPELPAPLPSSVELFASFREGSPFGAAVLETLLDRIEGQK